MFSVLLTGCQSLRPGDLLFHITGRGNAITAVTPGMTDHVAIYVGKGMVVEAFPGKGVTETPLSTVLHRSDGYYVAARVGEACPHKSIQQARTYIGLPYDSLYLADNDAIYCSELVQLSFVNRRSQPLFLPVPMSFHDSLGHITPFWVEFYNRHGMSVPEGQPGSNPGEMMQRKGVIIKKLKL
jgi:hypothetical protein